MTYDAADAAGNHATQVIRHVTIEDTIEPVAVCKHATVELDVNGNGSLDAAAVDNGSSDACGIDTREVAPSSFTCSEVGDNTVTLMVTDLGGNSDTCTSTVTVVDHQNPNAICQDGIEFDVSSDNAEPITVDDVDDGSSDACGIATRKVAPTSFTCIDVGDNIVTLTVTDNDGNSNTCTSQVRVINAAPTADAAGPYLIYVEGTTDDIDNGIITGNVHDDGVYTTTWSTTCKEASITSLHELSTDVIIEEGSDPQVCNVTLTIEDTCDLSSSSTATVSLHVSV